MAPIWNLLRSKQNGEQWNPALRGGLRSAIANRQYPQVRVKAAGWAVHDRCLLCLHDIVSGDQFGDSDVPLLAPEAAEKESQQRKPVVATEEQIDRAPVGSLHHRDWACKSKCIEEARKKWAPEKDLATLAVCDVSGHPAWEKGTMPEAASTAETQGD